MLTHTLGKESYDQIVKNETYEFEIFSDDSGVYKLVIGTGYMSEYQSGYPFFDENLARQTGELICANLNVECTERAEREAKRIMKETAVEAELQARKTAEILALADTATEGTDLLDGDVLILSHKESYRNWRHYTLERKGDTWDIDEYPTTSVPEAVTSAKKDFDGRILQYTSKGRGWSTKEPEGLTFARKGNKGDRKYVERIRVYAQEGGYYRSRRGRVLATFDTQEEADAWILESAGEQVQSYYEAARAEKVQSYYEAARTEKFNQPKESYFYTRAVTNLKQYGTPKSETRKEYVANHAASKYMTGVIKAPAKKDKA
jgi:hypothetical protein